MQLPKSKMRILLVTTHPPGKGSLNEYAYHFVRYLGQKPEVNDLILLTDELSEGQHYPVEQLSSEPGVATHFVSCWHFGAWNNPLRILAAIRKSKPDVVLFNIQFASFGNSRISAALGLKTPVLVRALGFKTVVLLDKLMDMVDLKSAGLAVLVSPLKRTQQEGSDVKFVLPREKAAGRILHLTRFDRIFEIVKTAEAALGNF